MHDRVIDGPAIRRRRAGLGLTRYEFARRSGVSVSYLKILEAQPAPDSRQPSDRIARIIAEHLNCAVEDISTSDSHSGQVAA